MAYRKPSSGGLSPATRITQEIIARLEAGTKPWVKPWRGVPCVAALARLRHSLSRHERVLAVDGRRHVRLRLALLDDLQPGQNLGAQVRKGREVDHRVA
jgi:hypothetical protein